MKPRFLSWRDLPENGAPVKGRLGRRARCYFGGKTPELVLTIGFDIVNVPDDDARPFAIGLEGYVRLERLLGDNIHDWPESIISIRRGRKRGFNYIEIVP